MTISFQPKIPELQSQLATKQQQTTTTTHPQTTINETYRWVLKAPGRAKTTTRLSLNKSSVVTSLPIEWILVVGFNPHTRLEDHRGEQCHPPWQEWTTRAWQEARIETWLLVMNDDSNGRWGVAGGGACNAWRLEMLHQQ
jgi:hypothetical protein